MENLNLGFCSFSAVEISGGRLFCQSAKTPSAHGAENDDGERVVDESADDDDIEEEEENAAEPAGEALYRPFCIANIRET